MPTRKSDDTEVAALRGLHLYHGPLSNNSMRVRLLLEEKGLRWESHIVDATKLSRQPRIRCTSPVLT